MKRFAALWLFWLVLLPFAGCGQGHLREQLCDLQPLLEKSQKVDSCLRVLQGIDTTRLVRNSDKARFSLLYAMALDKNYIDTTDLSVLRPAIDRYLKRNHLCRRDKFYTWYYRGRIEGNAGTFDEALSSFIKSERYMSAANDVYRARLYFAFEWVYNELCSFKEALKSAQEALFYAERSKDSLEYSSALLECAVQSSLSARPSMASRYMKKYESVFGYGHGPRPSDYYRVKMICCSNGAQSPSDSSLYYLKCYLAQGQRVYPMPCALTCIANGLYDEAESFLDDYAKSGAKYNSAYYYCRSRISEARGDYAGALKELHEQESHINKDYLHNLNEDISYLAEKYHVELEKNKRNVYYWTVSLLTVIVILILVIIIRRKQFEHRLLKQKIEDIRRELELEQKLNLQYQPKSLHKDDIDKVEARLLEMGRWFVDSNRISLMLASETLAKKMPPNELEGIISMLGSIYCLKYYSYLHKSGMTRFEIAYCILILKLSTKELEYIFKRKNLYNVNSAIQ